MNAHDDLVQLFRQAGAVSDSYREFDMPVLPTLLHDVLPSSQPVTLPAAPVSAVAAPESASPSRLADAARLAPARGEAYARIAAARYGLPGGSLG